MLAWQYGEGIGGKERDRAKAAMHYRLCAEQGHKIAQNNLGNAYYLGDGVARDPARAAYWFEKAAAQGYKLAQCNLGGMYRRGHRAERRAAHWYGKAAAQGDGEAGARTWDTDDEMSAEKGLFKVRARHVARAPTFTAASGLSRAPRTRSSGLCF